MVNASRHYPDRPEFRVLSRQSEYQLHLATLEVLEKTGVDVHGEEALDILREADCLVRDKRVRIPSKLVKQALASVPERLAIRNRNGMPAMYLEDHRPYYGTGSDCPFTLDIETSERRSSLIRDVASLTKLIDGLPNLDFVMSMAIPNDVPSDLLDVHEFVAMVSNTTNPLSSPLSPWTDSKPSTVSVP